MTTTYRSRRSRRRSEAVATAIATAVAHIAFDFAYALILALPVMFLTAHLAGLGWSITALSYWQSWWAAFLLSWIIDGASTVRRAIEKD